MNYLYRRIRDLREDHDLTQAQVAKYLHAGLTQYARYERGERAIPVNMLAMLAVLYKTSTDYLLGLTNNPKPPEDLPK